MYRKIKISWGFQHSWSFSSKPHEIEAWKHINQASKINCMHIKRHLSPPPDSCKLLRPANDNKLHVHDHDTPSGHRITTHYKNFIV